jgi:MFS family permease
MIAVPWLLVQVDGGKVFGQMALTMTIIHFFLSPWIGLMVDRFSRKKILLTGEALGFLVITFFTIQGFIYGYETIQLLLIYAIGTLYYNLFYPTMFAFIQEVFDEDVYHTLNGAMEVQGQVASMLAGGISSFLLTVVDLQWILLLDATTYLLACFLFWLIPYKKGERDVTSRSFFSNMLEGFRYMKRRPMLFFLLLGSFMPFIGVMMTNYLFPVYLSEELQVSGTAYSLQTTVYGIGAIVAGLAIPILVRKWTSMKTIMTTVTLYTIGITSVLFFKQLAIFYVLVFFMAFGNAGSRVARNTLVMEIVPNQIIGRVTALFGVIGLGIRIVLLSTFTALVSHQLVTVSFYILSVILIIATLVVFLSAQQLVNQSSLNKNTAM